MTTLFQSLVDTARKLEIISEGVATGGSTTTLIDTALQYIGWNDDDFNGGHAYLIRDAAGLSAAPEAESRLITDFASGSGTITVSAFSSAVGAGDNYGVTTNRYPRGQMVSKINQALSDYGDIPTEDITSLTTLADTTEYALPVAAKADLRQVWLATELTAPYYWVPVYTYRIEHGAANSAGNLIFNNQPAVGYKIKLVYMSPHPFIQSDTDKVSDYFSRDWLALEAAANCVRWRLSQPGEDAQGMTALLNDLLNRAVAAKKRNNIVVPPNHPRFGAAASL